MDQAYGLFLYGIGLLTFGGIYSILTLGLNIQWGFTGLFNAGVAGFFAIGAYVSAILTTAESARHLGGYDLPIPVGLVAAMVVAGLIAWAMGRVCIRLRADYLAIATLGIAEIFRLTLKNELWATNGARGVSYVPKQFETMAEPWNQIMFMVSVLAVVAVLYFLLERARMSPWGRVMSAIRENEASALAAGKNVERFRIQAFVVGAAIMGLGGGMMAHYLKFIDPQAADPSDRDLPGLGHADCRRQRQQQGRDPRRHADVDHLVGDRDPDQPSPRRAVDPHRLHPGVPDRLGPPVRLAALFERDSARKTPAVGR